MPVAEDEYKLIICNCRETAHRMLKERGVKDPGLEDAMLRMERKVLQGIPFLEGGMEAQTLRTQVAGTMKNLMDAYVQGLRKAEQDARPRYEDFFPGSLSLCLFNAQALCFVACLY